MRVLSLCSGYGGLELALERLLQDQVELVGTCDIYGPAREVLMCRFPESPVYRDVHASSLKYASADVVTFGFPCQGLSRASEAGLPHRRDRVFIIASRDWSLLPDLLEQDTPEPPEDLLPTPTVVDMGWGRTADEWERHRNGNGHGQSLYQALGCPAPEDACHEAGSQTSDSPSRLRDAS